MKRPRSVTLSALLCAVLAGPSWAVECQDVVFEEQSFTACEASSSRDIRLFLRDKSNDILGSFNAVDAVIGDDTLAFAMNAGMYHEDRRPVGLYIENSETITPASTGGGYGNFGLLPNGIFCINDQLQVWESGAYATQMPACTYATQSGPMLVIDGELHPKLRADGTSKLIRNGVGTNDDNTRATFVISNDAVNFHTFARFFRDHLALPNALFLDGSVSRIHAPSIGRSDGGFSLGPIIGIVDPSLDGSDADQ